MVKGLCVWMLFKFKRNRLISKEVDQSLQFYQARKADQLPGK